MTEEKKSWALTLLESVFGVKKPVPTNKRRCWRCRRKYDKTEVLGRKPVVVFDTDRFCSKACADTSPSYSEGTRQSRYFSFLQDATTSTRQRFYSGRNGVSWPEGMGRRNARKIMRGVARKALREIR